MKTMDITVNQLQDLMGLKNSVSAHCVMNLLKAQGLAVDVGKATRKGRGKPSTLYRVAQTVGVQIFSDEDFEAAVAQAEAETETEEEAAVTA